jgi:chemotaxis protein methyltransferase CheR
MTSERPLSLEPLEHELFRNLIMLKFGLDYPARKRGLLSSRLEPRVRALGLRSLGEYYRLLRYAPSSADEWRQLADAVTNNETYFFRDRAQLEAVVRLVAREPERACVRVLSAGCSSGEEAYSVAVLASALGVPPARMRVVGVDLNYTKVREAIRGRYDRRSFRDGEITSTLTPTPDGAWEVPRELRSNLRFEQCNLVEADAAERLGVFDIVLCRNVLIYAHERALGSFVSALARLLRPGGHLFVGQSESLLVGKPTFQAERIEGAFALRRE